MSFFVAHSDLTCKQAPSRPAGRLAIFVVFRSFCNLERAGDRRSLIVAAQRDDGHGVTTRLRGSVVVLE